MPVINNIQEFLALSSSLNYQLSGTPVNWQAILSLAAGEHFNQKQEEIIIHVFSYLTDAYGHTKRRLGPTAILHPIRAMALLSRAMRSASLMELDRNRPPSPQHFTPPEPDTIGPSFMDVLTILLHDKLEDITEKKYAPEIWQRLEEKYQELLSRIDREDRQCLTERIEVLTRRSDEMYYNYLGRLLDHAKKIPAVVHVKLADRLDNTLDLRMDLQGVSPDTDCFELIFAALFTNPPQVLKSHRRHPVQGKINGSRRLFQLFKNAIFLSLLRCEGLDCIDRASQCLFSTIVRASISEAQRNLVHLFEYHLPDVKIQREILQDVMAYCREGHIAHVTQACEKHRLDGLFKHRFDHADKATRNRHLDDLYQDKYLMAEVTVAFMAIFSSFLNDPYFLIKGIDAQGIHPDSGIDLNGET